MFYLFMGLQKSVCGIREEVIEQIDKNQHLHVLTGLPFFSVRHAALKAKIALSRSPSSPAAAAETTAPHMSPLTRAKDITTAKLRGTIVRIIINSNMTKQDLMTEYSHISKMSTRFTCPSLMNDGLKSPVRAVLSYWLKVKYRIRNSKINKLMVKLL